MLVPFINHTTSALLALSRHRMSALPSALKSPTPAMLHVAPGRGAEPPTVTSSLATRVEPFNSHTATSPAALRHRRSDLPSPSKSPMPATLHDGSGLTGVLPLLTNELPAMVVPSICHSASCPAVLRHRMSLLPSPLKSPAPATLHDVSGLTAPPPEVSEPDPTME